jgi:hypothetical protein
MDMMSVFIGMAVVGAVSMSLDMVIYCMCGASERIGNICARMLWPLIMVYIIGVLPLMAGVIWSAALLLIGGG